MQLSCLCGAVRVATLKRPEFVHECNCTLCSKSGARWGYFHPSEVRVEGAAKSHVRSDKADPGARIHFCGTCGATTHFTLTDSAVAKFGDGVMGVNMWLADPAALRGLELRFPDGRGWPGEGDFGYVREPLILG